MGLLKGITDGINEIFEGARQAKFSISSFGGSSPMFNPLPPKIDELYKVAPGIPTAGHPSPDQSSFPLLRYHSLSMNPLWPTFGAGADWYIGEEMHAGYPKGSSVGENKLPAGIDELYEVAPLDFNTGSGRLHKGTKATYTTAGHISPIKSSLVANPLGKSYKLGIGANRGNKVPTEHNEMYPPTEGTPYWDQIVIKENQARLNQVLEERSYVDFYFGNTDLQKRRVVFWENPDITESRSPRYASRNVVGRNEPMRLWVGSDARKVKLKFTYTHPHIAQFITMSYMNKGNFGDWENGAVWSKSKDYAKLMMDQLTEQFGPSFSMYLMEGSKSLLSNRDRTQGPRWYEQLDYNRVVEEAGSVIHGKEAGPLTLYRTLGSGWAFGDTHGPNQNEQVSLLTTYYIQYVIDTVRASVLGDTKNNDISFVNGPPIVRFRHGTVFNESPFIVTNFSINYDKSAGYETRSLLPRKIVFSLDLEEFRQTHGSQHGQLADGQLPGIGATIADDVQGASDVISLENFERTGRGLR